MSETTLPPERPFTRRPDPAAGVAPVMLDVRGVARLLSCSTRHVWRLADREAMPRPIRVGGLVRWARADVEAWILAGCPDCRSTGKGGRS